MDTTGNIAKQMKIGNTSIKICDDFCKNVTEQDVEEILKRIAKITIEPLSVVEEKNC